MALFERFNLGDVRALIAEFPLAWVCGGGAGTLEIAMRQIADAVQKMRAQDNRQRLIVSVEASFATTWLVSRLEDFRSRNPGISVLIDSSQRIVDLHRSDVDIAIR